jgi:hypothetical protein
MNMLANLATDDSIAGEKDSVGGASILDSALYMMEITAAYINKASSGALALVVHAKNADGKQLRQSFWMTSGTAKGGKNYYEKDGEKNYLPGFLHANSLALLTVGKEISELETEEKVIKLYSAEAKSEVPTKVPMLTELLNKEVLFGVIRQTVPKTKKNDNGEYVPTGETRDENEVDKIFRARDRMTTAEIRAKAEAATFADTWETKWAGKVKDKTKGATASASTAGAPKGAAPTGTKKPANSLFG